MALAFFFVLPFLVASSPGGLREYVDTVQCNGSGGDVVSSGSNVVSGNMVEDTAEGIQTGVDGDSVADTSGVATIEGDVFGSVSGDVANVADVVDASAGASSVFGSSTASGGSLLASSFGGQEVPIANIAPVAVPQVPIANIAPVAVPQDEFPWLQDTNILQTIDLSRSSSSASSSSSGSLPICLQDFFSDPRRRRPGSDLLDNESCEIYCGGKTSTPFRHLGLGRSRVRHSLPGLVEWEGASCAAAPADEPSCGQRELGHDANSRDSPEEASREAAPPADEPSSGQRESGPDANGSDSEEETSREAAPHREEF